jgi:hypothetical protein
MYSYNSILYSSISTFNTDRTEELSGKLRRMRWEHSAKWTLRKQERKAWNSIERGENSLRRFSRNSDQQQQYRIRLQGWLASSSRRR